MTVLTSPSLRILAALALLCIAPAQAAAQVDAADAARLVTALHVEPGQTVAEIGAGQGALTLAMARAVGPDGRVYSNEIADNLRDTIARAARDAGLSNVTMVASVPSDAQLPDGCCDAIFMRNVYHHFGEPAPMNASLFRGLKSGGRLAVIDFPPRNGEEASTSAGRATDPAHGVSRQSVERELRTAGFELVQSEQERADRWFMVVAQKP